MSKMCDEKQSLQMQGEIIRMRKFYKIKACPYEMT